MLRNAVARVATSFILAAGNSIRSRAADLGPLFAVSCSPMTARTGIRASAIGFRSQSLRSGHGRG
ncbi:hypothetical protein [Mycolicibacterium rutilum]|uniref:hypothetical protein n=1 Tax=Mycolicibacterium rutilum TaxID=370526 RepID=UPI0012FFAE41|nr:hypothetical protein [Mycolicibacterium rutilum]